MKNNSNSRGGGGLKSLKPNRAFTLAEVLITLAIIGIVAALTIPTLVSKNQNKQLYTQFMKTYNTLTNAFNMAMAENGNPIGWYNVPDDNKQHYITQHIFGKLSPYLKITKTCDASNYADCMPIDSYNFLNGSINGVTMGVELQYILEDYPDAVLAVLADGSSFLMTVYAYSEQLNVDFYIDVNGFKGPNVLGRDMQSLWLNNSFALTAGSWGEDCDTSNKESVGQDCAARMLQEGGMNY